MDIQNQKKVNMFKILTGVIICVGIIAAIAILSSKRTPDGVQEPKAEAETEEVSTTTADVALDPRVPYRTAVIPETADAVDAIIVTDQPAGNSIFLNQVTLSASGWVAVHEIAYDGSLGPILGAARFDTGTWEGNVVLLRSTVPKMQYRAVVYHDDGDKEFDFKRDDIVMRDAMPVMTSFRTY